MTVLIKSLVLSGKKLLAHSKVWEKPRFNLTILTASENTHQEKITIASFQKSDLQGHQNEALRAA